MDSQVHDQLGDVVDIISVVKVAHQLQERIVSRLNMIVCMFYWINSNDVTVS